MGSPNAGLVNARRYSVAVEVRGMLDLSSLFVAAAVPLFIGIVLTINQVDRFNDRAIRPIPVALPDVAG